MDAAAAAEEIVAGLTGAAMEPVAKAAGVRLLPTTSPRDAATQVRPTQTHTGPSSRTSLRGTTTGTCATLVVSTLKTATHQLRATWIGARQTTTSRSRVITPNRSWQRGAMHARLVCIRRSFQGTLDG
jgi:hypothetical protein